MSRKKCGRKHIFLADSRRLHGTLTPQIRHLRKTRPRVAQGFRSRVLQQALASHRRNGVFNQ